MCVAHWDESETEGRSQRQRAAGQRHRTWSAKWQFASLAQVVRNGTGKPHVGRPVCSRRAHVGRAGLACTSDWTT